MRSGGGPPSGLSDQLKMRLNGRRHLHLQPVGELRARDFNGPPEQNQRMDFDLYRHRPTSARANITNASVL